MADKISHVLLEIATADAWKVFIALVLAAVLMVLLMPITRFGFVLCAVAIFGWLSAMAVELSKANGINPRRVEYVGALGFFCDLVFAFPDYLAFAVPKALGIICLVLSGVGMLGCMCYLALCVGPLLGKLEEKAGARAGINASILVWLWPVGVWSLQPRLQQALRR